MLGPVYCMSCCGSLCDVTVWGTYGPTLHAAAWPQVSLQCAMQLQTTLPLLNLKFPDKLWGFEGGEMGGRSRMQPCYASQLLAASIQLLAVDSAHSSPSTVDVVDEAT